MKSRMFQIFVFLVACFFSFNSLVLPVLADPLTPDEAKAVNEYPNWVADLCGGSTGPSVSPGGGAPDGAQFPNLDPTSMANSIDAFVKKTAPGSPLNGLGATIVASSQHANINPFLVVAIANQETSLGTANTPQVTAAHNLFNRKATSSQPNVPIGGDLWYKWSSVKASVDNTAPENQNSNGGGDFPAYLRNQYGSSINSGDFGTLFALYDPGYSAYAGNVQGWMSDMIKGAQTAGGSPTSNNGSVYLLGDSVLVGAYYDNGAPLKQSLDTGGWSSQADASGGRGMSYPGTDPRGNLPGKTKSGLDAIKADSDVIKSSDTVVIELGTNETDPPAGADKSSALFKAEMEQAISEVKNINSSATIYWVNLFSKATQPYTPWVSQYNQVISSVASDKNINVIDTTNAGISLSPDGIHPDTAGYKTLSSTITSALNQAGSPSTPSASATCCPNGGASNFGTGTLPSSVPSPYNAIFTAAGNKFDVSPAFVAAIFYGGEHGNSWPDPPPPYGHGAPWATSPTGAQGPFQFEPYTWPTYAQDGNGDGKKDPQDLQDAAFAAADLLAHLGARGTTSESRLRQAAADYNGIGDPAASYPSLVWAAFQKFGGGAATPGGASPASPGPVGGSVGQDCSGSGAAASTTGYQDPMRDINGLVPERVDEGVDYSGSGPVHPLGNAKVTYICASGCWEGEAFITYQLLDGPAKDKYVYFAEGCNVGSGVSVGKTLTTNDVLCNMYNGPHGVETGWAGGATGDTAAAYSVYHPDGIATAYGLNFSQLMKSVGGKPGVPTQSTNWPSVAGTLPSGWPTWQ